jgi:hypothetical protein
MSVSWWFFGRSWLDLMISDLGTRGALPDSNTELQHPHLQARAHTSRATGLQGSPKHCWLGRLLSFCSLAVLRTVEEPRLSPNFVNTTERPPPPRSTLFEQGCLAFVTQLCQRHGGSWPAPLPFLRGDAFGALASAGRRTGPRLQYLVKNACN